MATGVHFAGGLGHVIGGVVFLDRKRIHIGAVENGRSVGSALQDGDHAGLADAGLDFQPELIKFVSDDAGGAVLLKAELGMAMKIAAARNQFVAQGFGICHKVECHVVLPQVDHAKLFNVAGVFGRRA